MHEPLEDALADLRISGSVLLHDCYTAPWAIDIPDQRQLQRMMGVDRLTRVMPFHLVRKGGFRFFVNGGPSMSAECDDVVVCTGGDAHRICLGATNAAVPLQELLRRDPATVDSRDAGATELICGVFMLRSLPLNPLFSALPDVLICKTSGQDANPLLGLAANMLAINVASSQARSPGYTRSRLLEIFCAEAIRDYQKQTGGGTIGWLQGLKDPKIAIAIGQIHANTARPWTVDQLAAAAALSPSRFAARFRDKVGTTVMDYSAKWRMNVACRLLADRSASIETVGLKVGYASAAAFSNAFRDLVGLSPAKWRKEQDAADGQLREN